MSLGPLYVLLGKVFFQVFAHFLIGCLSSWSAVMWIIYIFGDQTLVWGIICQYICPYCWLPFHFTSVFFSLEEAFYFDKIPFVYSFLTLGDTLVKILLHEISKTFLPMSSSRTFMVSWLKFKSFIHLEFILVYGVSCWSSFIFLHVPFQIFQHHLLKRLFLLHCMLMPPLSNINWP